MGRKTEDLRYIYIYIYIYILQKKERRNGYGEETECKEYKSRTAMLNFTSSDHGYDVDLAYQVSPQESRLIVCQGGKTRLGKCDN